MKELLAKPDTMRITTPVLPRETLERVLEIIRKDIAEAKCGWTTRRKISKAISWTW